MSQDIEEGSNENPNQSLVGDAWLTNEELEKKNSQTLEAQINAELYRLAPPQMFMQEYVAIPYKEIGDAWLTPIQKQEQKNATYQNELAREKAIQEYEETTAASAIQKFIEEKGSQDFTPEELIEITNKIFEFTHPGFQEELERGNLEAVSILCKSIEYVSQAVANHTIPIENSFELNNLLRAMSDIKDQAIIAYNQRQQSTDTLPLEGINITLSQLLKIPQYREARTPQAGEPYLIDIEQLTIKQFIFKYNANLALQQAAQHMQSLDITKEEGTDQIIKSLLTLSSLLTLY